MESSTGFILAVVSVCVSAVGVLAVLVMSHSLNLLRSDIAERLLEMAGRLDDLLWKEDADPGGTDPAVRQELVILRGELAEASESLTGIASGVDGLQRTVAGTRGDLAGLQSELADVHREVSAARGDLLAARTDVSSVRDELSSARTEVSSVRDELSSTRTELSAVRGGAESRRAVEDALGTLRRGASPDGLAAALDAVRSHGSPVERTAAFRLYYTNPSTPLPAADADLPDETGHKERRTIMKAVLESLPERLAGRLADAAVLAEVSGFSRQAQRLGVPAAGVADAVTLWAASLDGPGLGRAAIWALVVPASASDEPDFALAAALPAAAVRHRSQLPDPAFVALLAGLSDAVATLHSSHGPEPLRGVFRSCAELLVHGELFDLGVAAPFAGRPPVGEVAAFVRALGLGRDVSDPLFPAVLPKVSELLTSFPAGCADPSQGRAAAAAASHIEQGVRLLVDGLQENDADAESLFYAAQHVLAPEKARRRSAR